MAVAVAGVEREQSGVEVGETVVAATGTAATLDVLGGGGESDADVAHVMTAAPDAEEVLLGLVTPPAHGLDVALGQVVEHLAHVQILLDWGAEQFEAGVAGKFFDFVAGREWEKRWEREIMTEQKNEKIVRRKMNSYYRLIFELCYTLQIIKSPIKDLCSGYNF